jgi:mono/diheme cytochrome c family protein
MKRTLNIVAVVAATLLMMIVGGVGYAITTGLSARPAPGAIETRLARAVRRLSVPSDVREQTNPFASSPDVMGKVRNHYARYCATCHANDGSGDTQMGRNLFPRAPDMRQAATQGLSDGELFYIIEHGVRFTGMAAWGDGSPAGEELGWKLVQFIRQLPKLTSEDLEQMKELNP